jgi:hypothetical protein
MHLDIRYVSREAKISYGLERRKTYSKAKD